MCVPAGMFCWPLAIGIASIEAAIEIINNVVIAVVVILLFFTFFSPLFLWFCLSDFSVFMFCQNFENSDIKFFFIAFVMEISP